jgi:hypothetical protein
MFSWSRSLAESAPGRVISGGCRFHHTVPLRSQRIHVEISTFELDPNEASLAKSAITLTEKCDRS